MIAHTHTDDTDPRLDQLLHRWEELCQQGGSPSAEELCSTCPELAGELARRIALLRAFDPLLIDSDSRPQPTPAPNRPRDRVASWPRRVPNIATSASTPRGPGRGLRRPRRGAAPRGGPEADPRPARADDPRAAAGSSWRPRSPAGWSTPASCRSTAWARTPTAARATPCGSSAARPSRRPSTRFHAAEARRPRPGRARAGAPRAAGPVRRRLQHGRPTPTAGGCCTATSSRRNIMLGPYGETLVVDWGLAKPFDRAVRRRRRRGGGDADARAQASATRRRLGAVGTPAYMSPEQARGDLDGRGPGQRHLQPGGDPLRLLTGRPPFEGGDVGEVLRAGQAGRVPAAPAGRARRSPRALEAVCLKAMATRPADRYASARALADGRRALAGRRAGVRLARAGPGPGAAVGAAASHGGGGGGGGACWRA